MSHIKNDMDNPSDPIDFDDEQPNPQECDSCPHTEYCLYDHELEECRKK